jgi:hypothetical protein
MPPINYKIESAGFLFALSMATKNFNITQKDWAILKDALNQTGWTYWNVIDQWYKMPVSKHYDKLERTPIALILLNYSQKYTITVWGRTAWEAGIISEQHNATDVIKCLPSRGGTNSFSKK